MPKMGEIYSQNQHFWAFLRICSMRSSEILPDDNHWKVSKSNSFGLLKRLFKIVNSYYVQNGGIFGSSVKTSSLFFKYVP